MVGTSISFGLDSTGRKRPLLDSIPEGLSPEEESFNITIDTTNDSLASSSLINQFEMTGAEGDYDIDAVQNGSLVQTFSDLSGQETITLPLAGVYQIRVRPKEVGGFNRINFNNGGDRNKVLSIDGFGTKVTWSSFEGAFDGCSNLSSIGSRIYNGDNVTNYARAFRNNNITDLPIGLFNSSLLAVNFGNVFDGNVLSVSALSLLYIELSINNTQSNVPFGASSSLYNPSFNALGTTSLAARLELTSRGWTINDGGTI